VGDQVGLNIQKVTPKDPEFADLMEKLRAMLRGDGQQVANNGAGSILTITDGETTYCLSVKSIRVTRR
jgi:hypothetical protein